MNEIDEIKRRIDIVEFISQYITLKKAGTSYKALCPFHQEKTPSFIVSGEKQIWHCFGCGKGGSVIDFLMEYEGLEFIEALRLLAEKAGVKLQRATKEEFKEEKQEKIKLYEINQMAAKLWHQILLKKPKAQFIRDYLEKRKIKQETIKEFQLGYAPDSFELLSNFLMSKGYTMLDINKAGLVVSSEKKQGSYYDRFRDRLMFPISDIMGNIVGFSGRAMHETEGGKYINSPDTPIYSKSRILYGFDKAKKAIKEKNRVIIVEGQIDVISLHQAGYKNVVASSGTALTTFQLEILSRFTKNLSFAFDQDAAGEIASKRAIDLAHQMDFDVKIIITPEGKDPDECIRNNPKLWDEAVKNQKGAIDYFFDTTFSKYPKELDASIKREITKEILPTIKNISDKIIQSHYIQKLAMALDIPEKFLFEAIEKISAKDKSALGEKKLDFLKPKINLEERLLGIILHFPEFQTDFFKKINIDDFEAKDVSLIAKELKNYYNKKAIFKLPSFKKEIPNLATKIDLLVFPFEKVNDKDLIKEEYREYLSRFLGGKSEGLKKTYEGKIKEAEKNGDREMVKKLIKEFQTEVTGK